MSPEKQRIAIAEACGWKFIKSPSDGVSEFWRQAICDSWVNSRGRVVWGPNNLPDYLNDLNAMHEAEKTLSNEEINAYAYKLLVLPSRPGSVRYVMATAAQRAEAFLKTLGKWDQE